MKKLRILISILLCAVPSFAQQKSPSNPAGGNLTASSTNCTVAQSCVWQQLPNNANTAAVTLAGTFSETLLVEKSADGGNTFALVDTLSAAGVTSYSVAGMTDIRVRTSAFVSGSAAVTINTGLNAGQTGPTGPAGGAAIVPGVTGPPTTGLMARYDVPATDSAAALTDSSGNGRSGTGTEGTPPTIGAVTGGLVCGGAGSAQLPAALNSALSIAVFFKVTPPLLQTWEAPVFGNGNLTNTGANGFLLNTGVNANSDQEITTVANGAGNSTSWQPIWGTNSLIETMSTNDHIFLNGQEVTYFSFSSTSAGKQTIGFYQLCGNAAGSGFGNSTRFTGTIYSAYFYDHVLTAQEIAQLNTYWTSYQSARGVPPTFSVYATTNFQFTGFGTSLTQGINVGTGFVSQMILPGTWTQINHGLGSLQAVSVGGTTGLPTLPFYMNPYVNTASGANVATFEEGTNDCNASAAPAAIEAYLGVLSRNWRNLGGKAGLITMPDRAALQTCKNSLNALTRQNWSVTSDFLVDWASDARIGADSSMNGGTCDFGDHIHITQSCIDNDEIFMTQRAVGRLMGNRSFSEAATYTTTATATVATTAGSESTNTVTLTMGATPANCQAGNQVAVAGVTPAGYNSPLIGWHILTRSATQITYWADTGSMGVITVQGTVQCSSQQDADNYFILGGSATTPNFILQPCEGRTGQSDFALITNTTSPWTITPWGTEQINGGASFTAPTAVATNHQKIELKPILTSATAAGCSWQASIQ